ncbi:MAG: HI1450 family dsDNA-mimic protein [Enterobacter hormaechei]|nr:HI1450 family dsDNA-mimic protein [Enterobacter hormaechei]
MEMDLNNRLTEDETLEQAYDIFLELAVDNLDPADVILFNLQFEERGGAELFDPSEDWAEHVDFDLNPDFFAEVVIGLADEDGGEINDIFARVLLCKTARRVHDSPADTSDICVAACCSGRRCSYGW